MKSKLWGLVKALILKIERCALFKRRKDLEYKWILKGALTVQAYTAKLKNGKTYVVYAHDFNDMECFLTRLIANESDIAWRNTDSEFIHKKRMISYIPDKNGEPKTMPFWYRGRVYEINEMVNE